MRSVLLMVLLMVSVTQVQLSSLCPDSCVVCSTDVTICTNLSVIIEAPDSTKALMLTDGLINVLDHIVFSDLSNMSVLVLSNNIISTITGNAFRNLTVLRMLSLDHNLISSPSLDRSAFSWLRKLETLHLGHNALKEICGTWFQKTNSLKTLLLEGNLLTSLNSSTFASSDLRSLETLDLSDNLIAYVGRDSFRNLPRLSSLDLSRNRLQTMPDAFSGLSQLSMLNLDLNHWNCSCELRELAHFLYSYIQSPDKVLYNGKKMACTSSENPKVQTVLELTEANCKPANRTMTADIDAKCSIPSRRYVRDIVIAVVCSCLGGVVITLAVLAFVYRKFGQRFKPTQGTKGSEEQSSQMFHFSEGKDALSMSYALHNSNYRSHPPSDKDDSLSDTKPDPMGNHFLCQNCSLSSRRKSSHHRNNCRGIQPNIEEAWSNYMGSDQWKDTDVCPSRIQDEGRDSRPSTMRMQQIALRRQVSIAQRQTFTPEEDPNPETHNDHSFLKHQLGGYGGPPVWHHQPAFVDSTQDKISRNHEERIFPRSSQVIVYRDTLNYNQSNMDHRDGNQARVQRSVTFDLSMEHALFVSRKEGPYKISRTKMSKTKLQPKSKANQGKISSSGSRSSARSLKLHKPRSEGKSKLKIKLNLNPFRRSQVHPKSRSNHEDKDVKRTPKKIKKDKSHKRERRKKEKKSKEITDTPQCDQSSTNPAETQSLEKNLVESDSLMQSSNLLPEFTEPLETANTTDPQLLQTLDLNLALSPLEDTKSLQKEPQDGENLPNHSMTPVSSSVSVFQEYLSSGDGSPKRKIRLIVPEKTSSRPQTALEKKIR